MTLIVEDGTGKETADSYASIDTADTYISKWMSAERYADWSGYTEGAKEQALRVGTRFVDAHHFPGKRTYQDQALSFPRWIAGLIDGQSVSSTEVPSPIIYASIEATMKFLEGESLFPDHDGGTIVSESKQVGPISRSTQYQRSKKNKKEFETINALLRPFLESGMGVLSRGIG